MSMQFLFIKPILTKIWKLYTYQMEKKLLEKDTLHIFNHKCMWDEMQNKKKKSIQQNTTTYMK